MRFFVALFLFPLLVFGTEIGQKTVNLGNGIKVVLVKVEENPVVSCTVVFKVGLKHETPEINGVSHLLEHLVFNGTKKRTQKRLYADFDKIGCYNNASTSDHYTAYYILSSKENFEKAVEIQSDMLFHSIIPEDKMEKEKGIVKEEIRKDQMSPMYYEDMTLRKALFSGTPYSMKVIGTEKSVSSLKRDTVYRYYKKFYSPENAVILVAGDFSEKEVLSVLEKYFGSVKPVAIENKKFRINFENEFVAVNQPKLPYSVLFYVIKGVKADSPLFPFQQAYSSLLKGELLSVLGDVDPSLSVSTDYTDDYGLVKIRIKVKSQKNAEKVCALIEKTVNDAKFVNKKRVNEIKTSIKASTLFSLERPHFFGMLQSPYIGAGCENLIFYDLITFEKVREFSRKIKTFPVKKVFIRGKSDENKN